MGILGSGRRHGTHSTAMGQSERALSALSALLLLLLCVADSGDSSTTSVGNSTHKGEPDHSTPGTIVAEYGDFPPRHIVWTKLLVEKQYDRGDPPLWGQGGVTVDVMVRFLNILNVDAALGTFETDFSLRLFWHDERLRWAPEDLGGMTQFVLSAKDELNKPLWLPEISFLNLINVQTTGLLGVLTRVLSDGSVFWGRHVNAKFVTRYEFQWFPFDYQLLRISMASVKYSDNWQHLRFKDGKDPAGRTIPPVMMRQNIDHPLFTLERVSHFASKIYYEKWKDSFTTLYTVIVAKRETANYVTKMVLPVYLVVIASSLGYWVNPEVTAARIGLSIVCADTGAACCNLCGHSPSSSLFDVAGLLYAGSVFCKHHFTPIVLHGD